MHIYNNIPVLIITFYMFRRFLCAFFRENFYIFMLKLIATFYDYECFATPFTIMCVQTEHASIKNCRKSRLPTHTRHTNSRPSDIPVQNAKEGKSNSEEHCTEGRQLTSE
jgi:hypothetical protein